MLIRDSFRGDVFKKIIEGLGEVAKRIVEIMWKSV